MSALHPISATKFLCETADWRITNLRLQKVLYIAHMVFLGEENEPLVLGNFEAWDYGPVHPEVYQEVKFFGDDPIRDIFPDFQEENAEKEKKYIKQAVKELGDCSTADLVGITHWKGGAWAKNYIPDARGIIISNEDIKEEYRVRNK